MPNEECLCADTYSGYHHGLPTDISDAHGSEKHTPATQAEQSILFENAMQNTIFVRRVILVKPGHEIASDNRRRRRSTIDLETTTPEPSSSTSTDKSVATVELEFPSTPRKEALKPERNVPVLVNGTYTYYYNRTDANTTRLTLHDLRHFTSYLVSVKACRYGTGLTCSEDVTLQPRTLKRVTADRVRNLRVLLLSGGANYTAGSVQLMWEPPLQVNGMVVSYTIRYRRVDAEIQRGQDLCLSHTLLRNYTGEYTLKGMENGNYSFSVMATSLAGAGVWSDPVYLYVDVSIGGAVVDAVVHFINTILACRVPVSRPPSGPGRRSPLCSASSACLSAPSSDCAITSARRTRPA